jgi:N-ethylmaleimide reductase
MTDIWTPIKVGAIDLPHRLAMAPMTRSRAKADGTPGDLAALYYGQRAGLGLLVSEGTQPSDDGQGYLTTPGIYTDAHVEGWRGVAAAVHAKAGHLFIQLMHVGRMSHPDNTPHHRQAVAPSAIAPGVGMHTLAGNQPIPEPREMTLAEISQTVEDFVRAARRAVEAGADGVEVHAANGYLIHQFFAPNANQRSDAYGGDIANRIRFALEVTRAVAKAIGPERTAIRLSPGATLGGLEEGPESAALYLALVAELDKLGLAYLHLVQLGNEALLADIRKAWRGVLMVNRAGHRRDQIGTDIATGMADIESYAQMALANPDLVERLRSGADLNAPHKAQFYGGGAAGYTDYPTLADLDALAERVS